MQLRSFASLIPLSQMFRFKKKDCRENYDFWHRASKDHAKKKCDRRKSWWGCQYNISSRIAEIGFQLDASTIRISLFNHCQMRIVLNLTKNPENSGTSVVASYAYWLEDNETILWYVHWTYSSIIDWITSFMDNLDLWHIDIETLIHYICLEYRSCE